MKLSIKKIVRNFWPFILLFSTLVFALAANTYRAQYRWYDEATLQRGAQLFRENCVACHKVNAEGTTNWKVRDANGNLPPTPLNGTAHAWHHPKATLVSQILDGAEQYGRTMPGFGQKLSTKDAEATIAFFQSKWSDSVYQQWEGRNE